MHGTTPKLGEFEGARVIDAREAQQGENKNKKKQDLWLMRPRK